MGSGIKILMFSWSRRKAFNPETGSFQPRGPTLDAKESTSHLDYCKDLPTASSSLKAVSFGGNVLKPRSDRVTLSSHPTVALSTSCMTSQKPRRAEHSRAWPCLPTWHERSLSTHGLVSGRWMKLSTGSTERLHKAERGSRRSKCSNCGGE